jgi:hypothetical protein
LPGPYAVFDRETVFQHFFEYVVELCQAAGLVWGKELFIDATKVRTNADVDSLVPRFHQVAKQHLQNLFAEGEATGGTSEELPIDIKLRRDKQESHPAYCDATKHTGPEGASCLSTLPRVSEAVQTLLTTTADACARTSDLKVSTTDPDAVPMRARNGAEVRLGFHDHYIVDGGKACIILAALVTPADVMENQAMVDLVQRVRFRWHIHPKRVIGDTTDGTVETIPPWRCRASRPICPLPDWEPHTP